MEESLLNQAVHTSVDELTDEQKQLITDSWAALDDEQKEVYASLAPEEPATDGEAQPE